MGGYGDWADIPCDSTTLNGFLCNRYDREFSDNYVRISKGVNYYEAEEFCNANYGTHLASFHSVDEKDELMDVCLVPAGETKKNCWIGLTDIKTEDSFEWNVK